MTDSRRARRVHRPPEYYVLPGRDLVMPEDFAPFLYRYLRVEEAAAAIGENEVRAFLEAWRVVAVRRVGADVGTSVAASAEPGRSWLRTSEAATALGIGERAVRKAIAEGRLRADSNGGTWLIPREAIANYRADRTTR